MDSLKPYCYPAKKNMTYLPGYHCGVKLASCGAGAEGAEDEGQPPVLHFHVDAICGISLEEEEEVGSVY